MEVEALSEIGLSPGKQGVSGGDPCPFYRDDAPEGPDQSLQGRASGLGPELVCWGRGRAVLTPTLGSVAAVKSHPDLGVNMGDSLPPVLTDHPRELAVLPHPRCPVSSLGWESQSRGLAGNGANVGALLGELPGPVTSTGPTLSPGRPLLRVGQPPGGISGHTDGQGMGMKGRPHGWCGVPTPARPGSCESALGVGKLWGGLPAAQPCPAEGSWGLGSGGRDCRGGQRALRQWDHFYKMEHTCLPPHPGLGERRGRPPHNCCLVGNPQSPHAPARSRRHVCTSRRTSGT